MALQWTNVQPSEEGYYWVSRPGSTEFEIVYLRDGECSTGRDGNPVEPASNFDLWSWPVTLPPAPVRPQKETKNAPVSKSAKA